LLQRELVPQDLFTDSRSMSESVHRAHGSMEKCHLGTSSLTLAAGGKMSVEITKDPGTLSWIPGAGEILSRETA